ncbi:hypothetical protein CFP56_028186 [Quercus suber]|uniref:Uncharacterized protein n=1 Tax=Quercus suber TaxID=58331 RepID=A0AAW0JVL4_QUESU
MLSQPKVISKGAKLCWRTAVNNAMHRLRTQCMHCGHVRFLARYGNSRASGSLGWLCLLTCLGSWWNI